MVVLSDRFADAFAYANAVHRKQRRKGTEIPYVSHLLAVASIVLEAGGDEDEAIAALLHDAPEDQGGHPQLEQIRARFGERVAAIVEGCSDSLVVEPWAKEDWRVRKKRYHDRARQTADSSVLLVSAADKLHNARATLADLQRVGPAVWDRFTGGRDGSLWNYETLLKLYADSGDPRVRQLAAELDPIVKALEEY
jgi:(p)ppGpp synthase/HD superfamily hydrolase